MECNENLPGPFELAESNTKVLLGDAESMTATAESTDPIFKCSTSVTPISGCSEALEKYDESACGNPQDVSARESMDQALKSEKAFIEYVMSLPSAPASKDSSKLRKVERKATTKPRQKLYSSSSSTTKVGLDHLDNLCKLMEQLSELKDTNTKLHKRVQYLEDLKTLHEMHKEIRSEAQYGSENVLSEQGHLSLKKNLTNPCCTRSSPRGSEDYSRSSPRDSEEYCFQDQRLSKNTRSPSGRRTRAAHHLLYDGHRRERSKSVGHEEVFDGKSRRIFPKWSKVKEAFGFESERKDTKTSKFYYNVCKTAEDENVFTPNRRIFTDLSAPIRLPLNSDCSDKDGSLAECCAGEAMVACNEGFIPSFNSSVEDIIGYLDSCQPQKWSGNSKRNSASSEKRISLLEPSTDGSMRRIKSTPSPGSDKIRTYHDFSEGKNKSHTADRSPAVDQMLDKYDKDESKKSHKSPWGRVKTIIEKRRDSLKRRHFRRAPHINPSMRCHETSYLGDLYRDDYTRDTIASYDSPRKSSDEQYLPTNNQSSNDGRRKKPTTTMQAKDLEKERIKKAPPPIQINPTDRLYFYESRVPSQTAEREGEYRTPGSSPQLNRKSTWMKMKNVLKSKKAGEGPSSQSMPSSPNGTHQETFDFEDTYVLEDNTELECYKDGHEITRIGSDSYVNKHSLSTSTPVADIMLELQRNVSEDFTRKMQEWERIRSTRVRPGASPKWERANSGPKARKKSEKTKIERYEKSPKPKIKDLAWLEKELQKIEKEKQRLSKEKEKYEERAIRLERLRQTVLTARNSNKKEVLVRTSAGEFRFEGISDAFTKKLYEWETKRGLGPEFSTIALLDSSLGGNSKNCLAIQQIEKGSNLQRGLSRSESSIAEIGQLSHNSSNSLPSLKPPDNGDFEKIHHHSRANSEPDLSNFVGSNANLTTNQNHTAKSSQEMSLSETQPKDSYAHPEVTQLIDSDVDEVLADIEDPVQAQRDENYYSLLEENVILLEQLKHKEEICRRLENELELLDEKVDEMSKHHKQEMEKYREKLWEMHKPGNTPREVQSCLQVMTELRTRIENLERCSEKLKNEKETLQNTFRIHSEEQENMTLDLLDKMTELQAAGDDTLIKGLDDKTDEKKMNRSNFDIKIVERLQDLSSQIVKQTQELERTLADRTRQICQLRWELLNRDVSTVKLETELHNAHMQSNSPQTRSKSNVMRSKYAHFRSWSSEEASSQSKQLPQSDQRVQNAKQTLQAPYYKLLNTEFKTIELSNTVQELNKEVIRLSAAAENFLSTDASLKGHSNQSTDNQIVDEANAMDLQSQNKDLTDFPLSTTTYFDISETLNNQTSMTKSKISVRRNSASSVSMASGIESISKSSSFMDDNNISPKLYQRPHQKITWSDSDSFTEEETFTRVNLSKSPDIQEQDTNPQILCFNKFKSKEAGANIKKINNEVKTSQQGLKKKMLYKPSKLPLKTNNQTDESFESTTSSVQKQYDNAFNKLSLTYYNKNKPSSNETDNDSVLKNANSHLLRSSQSASQVQIKKTQPHSQIIILGKDLKKSDTVACVTRTNNTMSVSKTNISKSIRNKESFSTSSDIFQKTQDTQNDHSQAGTQQSIDKKQSFKKKFNGTSKPKGVSKISNAAKRNIQPKEGKEDRRATTDVLRDPGSSSVCEIQENFESTVTHINQIAKVPKVVLKRKLFLFEPQGNSPAQQNKLSAHSSEHHTSEEKHRKIITESNNLMTIKRPLLNDESRKIEKFYNEASPTSTFIVKLPKRKANTTEEISKSKTESKNDTKSEICNKELSKTPEEQTVTVIIPRRRASKSGNISTEENSKPKKYNEVKKAHEKTEKSLQSERLKDIHLTNNLPEDIMNKIPCKVPLFSGISAAKYGSSVCKLTSSSSHGSFQTNSFTKPDIAISIDQELKYIDNLDEIIDLTLKEPKTMETELDSTNLKTNFLQTSKISPSLNSETKDKNSSYMKSPSAPQLDWTKACAKKVLREGAPNVKTLIEKFNQKVLDSQTPQSPYSSKYNSPAAIRKISAPSDHSESYSKNIPCSFSSTPNSPKISNASTFCTPFAFKHDKLNASTNITRPPTSPSAKSRAEALLKAKENFMSSSSISFTSENWHVRHNGDESKKTSITTNKSPLHETVYNTTKTSATDPDIPKRVKCIKFKSQEKDNIRKSLCSNKSWDSMSLVLFKTGETCQESRMSKRCDKQKPDNSPKLQDEKLKTSKSLSNSSIFKTVTGHDIKLPSSFLRLRRSRRKKDITTVSQLCRQSLLLGEASSSLLGDTPKSPRSCPSSPELASKTKAKPSWLQRNIFRHK